MNTEKLKKSIEAKKAAEGKKINKDEPKGVKQKRTV